MYQVIIYYKITPVGNPKHEEREQTRLLKDLNVKGRILISKDGINGTLAGLAEDIQK